MRNIFQILAGKSFYYKADDVKKFKINLIVGITILYAITLIVSLFVLLTKDYQKLAYLNLGGIGLLSIVFYLLRIKQSLQKSSYFFCISHLFFVITYIYLSGGHLNLAFGFYLLVLILFANFNLGKKCGLFASAGALITLTAYSFLNYAGFSYPYAASIDSNIVIFNIFPAILCIFYFNYTIFSYLKVQKKLEKNLQSALYQKDSIYNELKDNHKKISELNTEQQKLINHLENSEKKYKEAQHLANLGNWCYYYKTGKFELSEEIFHQVGIENINTNIKFSDFIKYIFHEDIKLLNQNLRKAVRNNSSTFVIRVNKENGETGYLKITAKPFVNNQNKLAGICGSSLDITDLRKAHEKSLKSEKFLKESQKIALIGSWELNLVNGEIKWSEETYNIFGVDENFALNLTSILNFFDNEYANILKKNIYESISKGNSFDLNLLLTTPSYNKKWVRAIGKVKVEKSRPVKLSGVFQDITLQKENERLIRESEEKYKTVVNNIKEIIFRIDTNGYCTFLNPAWYNTTGFYVENTVGNYFFDYVYPEEKEKVIKIFEDLKNNNVESRSFETRYLTARGSFKWMHVSIGSIKDKNNVTTSFFGTLNDITEEKITREELIKAKEYAEEASLAKERFLSTISHDMRTPLNAIVGFTQLLLDETPRQDQLEKLNALKFSGDNLLLLINDILDFNKINSGNIKFESHSFDIHELIESIIKSLSFKADKNNVSINYIKDIDLKETINGDSIRLYQILNNLIDNAVKFTKEGEVSIKIKKEEEINDNQIKIYFEIADTGIGIDSEKIDKIFDPFSQAEKDTARNYGGTGLGLAITRRLVELHGSKIYVNSYPGKGTTFYFSLSFKTHDSEDKKVIDNLHQNKDYLKSDISGNHILIAEDNNINVMLIKQFLKKWNITVEVAENGNEAIKKLNVNHYDLILMDLQMPDKDGYEVTKILRQMPLLKNLPVLALTAAATSEVKDKVLNAGMDDYIIKPFKPEDLFLKLKYYLNKQSDFYASLTN